MKRCQIDCDLIAEFDLFGKEPEFYFKGKSQRVSWFGRIFSVFYIVLYAAFVIYKLVRMLKKVDIDFYETYAFSGVPSIELNNDLFYGGYYRKNYYSYFQMKKYIFLWFIIIQKRQLMEKSYQFLHLFLSLNVLQTNLEKDFNLFLQIKDWIIYIAQKMSMKHLLVILIQMFILIII